MNRLENLSQNEIREMLADKYISREEASKLGISKSEAQELTYKLSGGEITEEDLVTRFLSCDEPEVADKKGKFPMKETLIGAGSGALIGVGTGRYFLSKVAENVVHEQNYKNAIKEGLCMIFDKKGKPINTDMRFNRTMAKLGKNPSLIGKIALGAVVATTIVGGLIGYISGKKA